MKYDKNKFGKYEILDFLGEGGMGKVYKAYDTKLKRNVALKILIKEKGSDLDLKRFRIESQAMARLNHPNIVQFYEFGDCPNHFITMEYIEGYTLSKLVKDRNIDPLYLVDIMIKLCDGLAYAHRNKIFHRDIKPSNIMILESGEPKIMDFGLAKVLDSEDNLSKTGGILGTPVYMSPEQIKGEYSKQSDIYSMGATIYEALTYRCLFQGSPINIMFQISHEDPILPSVLNPDISPYLEAICLKCIDKKKEKRYKNFKVLSGEFSNFKNNLQIIAKPYTTIDMLKKSAAKHRIIVASFVIILTIIISSFFYAQEKRKLAEKSLQKERLANQNTSISLIKLNLAFAKIHCDGSRYQVANEYIEKCYDLFKKVSIEKRFTALKKNFTKLKKKVYSLYSYQVYPNLPVEQSRTKFKNQCITRSPSLNWFATLESDGFYISNIHSNYKKKLGPKNFYPVCAFSKNDLFFAYGDSLGNIYLWDIRNKKIITRRKIEGTVKKLIFSSDGKMLFSQNGNQPIVWSVPNMRKIFYDNNFKNREVCANFSPNQKLLALGYRHQFELLNILENKIIKSIDFSTRNKNHVCFSPNGKSIAFSAADQFWICNSELDIKNSFKSKNGNIENFIWNSNQTLFAFVSNTGYITILETQNYQKINTFLLPIEFANNFITLEFSANKNILNVWTKNHFISYRFDKNKEHTTLLKAKNITKTNKTNPKLFKDLLDYFLSQKRFYDIDVSCTLSPNDRFVVYDIFESAIFLYDNKEKELSFLSFEKKKYQNTKHKRIAFTEDSSLVMISTKEIREIWNTKSKKRIALWQDDHRKINPQCFYTNNSFISINRKENTIEFYFIDKVEKTYRKFKIEAKDAIPEEGRASISKNIMFFAGHDMQIFDLKNNPPLLKAKYLLQDKSFVTANCFFSKKQIAIGFKNGIFKIWDWGKNKILHEKKFSESITDIKYDQKMKTFWISTSNNIYIYDPWENSDKKKLENIFPISLHQNYKGKSISNNFSDLFFLSHDLRFFKLTLEAKANYK